MTDVADMDLVREFARLHSEAAFTELVRRHLNLVYAIARRCTASDSDAQDVAQAVFVILARKAAGLRPRTVLTGWLYETTRHTAACWQRTNLRRQWREQEACRQSTLTETGNAATDWHRLCPHLEAAMAELGEGDRTLLALRYYENKSARESAALLGIQEAAVYKRTTRAVEKLRNLFNRRGVALSAVAIAGAMSAHARQAAPVGLAPQICGLAAPGAVLTGVTTSLAQGTLKALAWAKFKTLLSLWAVATLAGSVVVMAVLNLRPHKAIPAVSKPMEVPREVMTDTALISLDSPPGGLALQPDGKIVVAASLFGNFIDPGSGRLGYFERGAIRLNTNGSLDRSFYCSGGFSANDSSRAHVTALPDGKLLLSGLFDSAEGRPRPGYARFLADGSVDESFVPTGSTNAAGPVLQRTYLPGGTYPAAALNDGLVAVMANQPLSAFRLDAGGRLMPSATTNSAGTFPPHAGLIWTLQGAGFWGNWWGHQPVDWKRTAPARRRPLVKPSGQLPFEDCAEAPSATDAARVFQALFAEVPFALCRVAVPLPDGGAVLGIQDEFINGSIVAPGRLMRFDQNWRPDFSFTNRYAADLRGSLTIKRLRDGKLLVAGGFTTMNGAVFPGLVRLWANGQIDPGFHCQVGEVQFGRLIMDMAVQDDGRIVICGPFTVVNGVHRQHIARLNPDGSLDDTFQSPFLSPVELQAKRRFPVYHLANKATSTATNLPAPPADPLPAETIWITSLNYQGGTAVIQFTGHPNTTYILQARDGLAESSWSNLSTNRADAAGKGGFRDGTVKNHPARFYRLATP